MGQTSRLGRSVALGVHRRFARTVARLPAHAPHRQWKTCTAIAALRHNRVEAPWLLDASVNGECFRLYVERGLAPTLKPRDLAMRDNLGGDKAKSVRRAIRAAGATPLFVAKYAPDLNPTVQQFAKLKHWLRNAAERTRDAVCSALAQILDTISPAECANDLVNSGSARSKSQPALDDRRSGRRRRVSFGEFHQLHQAMAADFT